MKHNIDHRESHNGLIYTVMDESRLAETTDFFYNYFLTGNIISDLPGLLSYYWIDLFNQVSRLRFRPVGSKKDGLLLMPSSRTVSWMVPVSWQLIQTQTKWWA